MDKKTSGFTLIEMLVGIVIGMIVVAAASVMMVTVLKSQKDVTASARLNQELGAAMAVMSNEIRRAGFRICDESDVTLNCENFDPYLLGDDIIIGDVVGTVPPVKGDCVLYRYNANVDDEANDSEEQRGFRLYVRPKNYTVPNDVKDRGVIQISKQAGGVKCDDPHDFNDPTNNKWENLTDPDVIDIDFTGSIFSTTGSKCRNMSGNFYWVVGDGATGLACDDGTKLDSTADCIDLNDPVDPLVAAAGCGTATTVMSDWVTDKWVLPPNPPQKDALFGVNQIRINLQATLTRDSAVSKNLKTSVKVANPWIRLR